MTFENRRMYTGSVRLFGASICAAALWVPQSTDAQVRQDDECSHPKTHRQYVRSFDKGNQTGVPHEQAVNTLLCIATQDQSRPPAGSDAVRALFAVGDTDREARELMLRIALNKEISVSVHDTSCELLTLVADSVSIATVLESMKAVWPSGHWHGYSRLLRDVGDESFLEWLEEQMKEIEVGSPFHEFLELAATRVKIQKTPDKLLKHLESAECWYDCSWYVLQASRHGIDQKAIRQTVMDILGSPMENRDELYRRVGLLRDCHEFGVLTEDDVKQFPRIWKATRQSAQSKEDHRRGKEWVAKCVAKKHAKFYRLTPRTPEEE